MAVSDSLGEFLFGRLSTPEGRLEEARRERLGFFPLSLSEPFDPRPGEPVRISCRCGTDTGLTEVLVFWTDDGTLPRWNGDRKPLPGTRCTAAARSAVFWDDLTWGYGEDWKAEIPPQGEGTLLQYAILGWDAAGACLPCPGEHPLVGTGAVAQRRPRHGSPHRFAVGIDRLEPAQWLQSAVIYQVLPDRFAADPGRKFREVDLEERLGGTLDGLTSRLGELRELGVNCLWLTPIFPSPLYHGYASTDLLAIEPALGGREAWRSLVEEARRQGMRIILDFVANHLSDLHPAFREALRSPDNPTRSWFRFTEWPSYDCFFDAPHQPELDAEQEEVREHLLEAARHWLGEGCDGFRLDHAHGQSHGFWSRFRAATRGVAPESANLGEITATPKTLLSYSGRMDGCLDFPLCQVLRETFARRRMALSTFDRQVRCHLAYFGDQLVLPSFLDNHDMNRFLWVAGGDRRRLKLAALCQFCLPGPPVIYYGTEVGLGQREACGRLEEARLPMPPPGAGDGELRRFYTELAAMRALLRPWLHPPAPFLVDDARDLLCWRIGPALLVISRTRGNRLTLPAVRLLTATSPEVCLSAEGRVQIPAGEGALLAAQ